MPNCSRPVGLACSLAFLGCSVGVEQRCVTADARVDQTTGALSAPSVDWVNGTYGAGCIARSGSWSARASSGAAMTNAALTVVQSNTACQLTMTSVVAGGVFYAATPSRALGTTYAGEASFAAGGGSLAFYGTAKLSSGAFGSAFTINLLVADDPSNATVSSTATFERHSVGGTVSGLTGTGLRVKNGAELLTIAGNGAFVFPTIIVRAASYDVTVDTQPASPAQSCTVTSGSGQMGSSDVANITIDCTSSVSCAPGTLQCDADCHLVGGESTDCVVECLPSGAEWGLSVDCGRYGDLCHEYVPGTAYCG